MFHQNMLLLNIPKNNATCLGCSLHCFQNTGLIDIIIRLSTLLTAGGVFTTVAGKPAFLTVIPILERAFLTNCKTIAVA